MVVSGKGGEAGGAGDVVGGAGDMVGGACDAVGGAGDMVGGGGDWAGEAGGCCCREVERWKEYDEDGYHGNEWHKLKLSSVLPTLSC